jgi:hypothetical protein
LAEKNLRIDVFCTRGGWGNAKTEKSVFTVVSGFAQILEIVAQIHTNGALMYGRKKFEN